MRDLVQGRGFVERSVKTLGVTEAFFGPQTEILISRSSDGPLKYVSWNIPGIIYGLKGDRQDIEIFGSQGSGSTETFTASQGGEDYVINSVSVQKFGMAYVYKNLRPIKLKAGLSKQVFNLVPPQNHLNTLIPLHLQASELG